MGRKRGVMDTIVGREAELDAIERLLAAVPDGPAALVIEGQAGIGKTTVWLEGVRRAGERGFRILEARPAESEARLSYAALADLVTGVVDDVAFALPAVQQRALDVALLRGDPNETAEPRTTATALVSILSALAVREPVLVAIDDVQWLDPDSEHALAFAARRLSPGAALLLSQRTEGPGELPLGLERALDERVERVVPGPLSLAGLHHLIADRLGSALPRPLLVRLADACGGNPFFALEIARSLGDRASGLGADEPLPVPRSVGELVATRLGGLSDAAQQAALAAAALSHPSAATLAQALEGHGAGAALMEAEDAGVLVSERDGVRFTHPLLASGIYGTASPERRRRLHRRLADVVADPEERARHLALSATEPDEAIAGELERAAAGAAQRGAQAAAAELYDAARRLTPVERGEDLTRRELGQAVALLASGDVDGARSLAERVVATDVAPLRAQALFLLGDTLWVSGMFERATEHLEAALAAAPDDKALAARIHPRLVNFATGTAPARALERADAAMAVLDAERTPGPLSWVVFDRFWAGLMLGEREQPDVLERWRELEERAGPEAPKTPLPLIYFHSIDDFDAARARHAVEDEWYGVRGEEAQRAERLAHLGFVEFRAGRWDEAERLVEESCATIAQLTPSERLGPWTVPFRFRSLVDAARGRTGRARATLLPLIEQAAVGKGLARHWEALFLSTLAFAEFAEGDYRAADDALTRMHGWHEEIGTRDFVPDRSEPFHVEALLALGEHARAREALERLERRGRTFPRVWIAATLPRTRAVVLAAEGDVEQALVAINELDRDAAARLPFDLGWTLLVRGRLHRRAKQRRAAADALAEALEFFEGLGAPIWIEQARHELGRVGLRRAPAGLTATEQQVAELAAAGLTNKEVAAKAFMSPKTVEANLARIYRKLGIRSRAELGARIGGRPSAPVAAGPATGGSGRELTTVLFTDLVDSTAKARALGDAAWVQLVARHNTAVRRELARFGGEEVDTAGDGFLAVFAAPARAIQCALAIRKGLDALGLAVRMGVHTGEVERRPGEKPRGIAVVLGARIMSLAGAGEVLVSATTRDLVAGSGLEFEDRGEHELRGIEGTRRVFAAAQM